MAGFFLLSTAFLIFAIACIVFASGGSVESWIFPVSTAVALSVTIASAKDTSAAVGSTGIGLAVIILSTIVSAFLYDNSYDGNAYHQESIILLYDGWNPFRQQAPTETLWVAHYAKFLEIASACIAKTTGSIESGKAINLIIFFAMAFVAYPVITNLCSRCSRHTGLLITICLCMNPVVMAQLLTFYNDYALYCYIVILVALYIILFHGLDRRISLIFMALVTVISADTKFTHFFYVGIVWGAIVVHAAATHRKSLCINLSVAGICAALTGFFLTGFHPYITNISGFGNPFYPLVGSDIDIMTNNTPDLYLGGDRFSNFFVSLFSGTKPFDSVIPDPSVLIRLNADTRTQGFGPFMPLLLILSIMIMVLSRGGRSAWYAIAVATIMTFCFEQSWWARYTPFIWLIPVISMTASAESRRRNIGSIKFIRIAMIILMSLTGVVALATGIAKNVSTRIYRESLFKELQKQDSCRIADNNFYSLTWKMHRRRIKTIESPLSSLDSRCSLYIYGTTPGMPVVELSESGYASMTCPSLKSRIMLINTRKISAEP